MMYNANPMRLWAAADPRLLCRKHLLGEHLEAHMLFRAVHDGAGWIHHPEAKRFEGRPDLIVLRHELLVSEMLVRWPKPPGEGDRTPLTWNVMDIDHIGYATAYRHGMIGFDDIDVSWPPSPFGADTPWDRDGMTMEQYVALGDSWNALEHKNGGTHAAR